MKNFWYYHKFHVLIALGAVIIIFFSIRPSFKEEKEAEFCLGIVSSVYYDDEDIAALKQTLSEVYGSADISVYHIMLGAEGQDSAEISALDLDLISKKSCAFLLEDYVTFREVTGFEMSEPVPAEELEYFKNTVFNGLTYITRLDYTG